MRVFRRASTLSAVAVAALLIAACGSSSTKSSTSSGSPATAAPATSAPAVNAVAPAGTKPATGSPIKIGMISPNTGPIAYPGMYAAAASGVIGANERGGLDGHKIVLVDCDEGGNPNLALACARKLVADHVVAAVSDESPSGEPAITKVLGAAKIPQIGTYALSTAAADPYNFNFIVQGVANAGIAAESKALNAKKLVLIQLELPISTAYRQFFGALAKHYGQSMTTVQVPLTASDASSFAGSAIAAQPQALELLATSQIDTLVSLAALQQGFTGKLVGDTAPFTTEQISTFKQAYSQYVGLSFFPPVTDTAQFPVYRTFDSDMAAGSKAGISNVPAVTGYVQDQTINGWLSVMALQKIANAAHATTTAQILAALRAAKDVSLGLIPSWTPNAQGPKAFPRASNPYVYVVKFSGTNTEMLVQPQPLNVESAINAAG